MHVNRLATQGLPRVEVLTNPSRFPEVVLSGRPSPPDASASLGTILQSLGVVVADKAGALGKMWMRAPGDNLDSPPLMKKQPASFLIITPASNGEFDFNQTRLVSVWLDGQQVALKSGGSD